MPNQAKHHCNLRINSLELCNNQLVIILKSFLILQLKFLTNLLRFQLLRRTSMIHSFLNFLLQLLHLIFSNQFLLGPILNLSCVQHCWRLTVNSSLNKFIQILLELNLWNNSRQQPRFQFGQRYVQWSLNNFPWKWQI